MAYRFGFRGCCGEEEPPTDDQKLCPHCLTIGPYPPVLVTLSGIADGIYPEDRGACTPFWEARPENKCPSNPPPDDDCGFGSCGQNNGSWELPWHGFFSGVTNPDEPGPSGCCWAADLDPWLTFCGPYTAPFGGVVLRSICFVLFDQHTTFECDTEPPATISSCRRYAMISFDSAMIGDPGFYCSWNGLGESFIGNHGGDYCAQKQIGSLVQLPGDPPPDPDIDCFDINITGMETCDAFPRGGGAVGALPNSQCFCDCNYHPLVGSAVTVS
jgi:hypothetical protein